jgi:hypothetical protein
MCACIHKNEYTYVFVSVCVVLCSSRKKQLVEIRLINNCGQFRIAGHNEESAAATANLATICQRGTSLQRVKA